jgi:2-oxoglutarate dehydrogenase E1 component
LTADPRSPSAVTISDLSAVVEAWPMLSAAPEHLLQHACLLRHPEAYSTLDDLATGGFQRVIPDTQGLEPREVKKILLCAGKIYYDLDAARKKQGRTDVAILRLEQIYPLSDVIVQALAPYREGTPVVWVQEEPRNSGAWYFLNANLRQHLSDRHPLSLVSRAASASTATGSKASHDLEQKLLIEQAFAR